MTKMKTTKAACALTTPRRVRGYVCEFGHIIKRYGEANNLPEVEAMGAKLIMYMRYDESLEDYILSDKAILHPTFERYVSAYVAQPSFTGIFGDAASAILKTEFVPDASPHLPSGHSLWPEKTREPYPSI